MTIAAGGRERSGRPVRRARGAGARVHGPGERAGRRARPPVRPAAAVEGLPRGPGRPGRPRARGARGGPGRRVADRVGRVARAGRGVTTADGRFLAADGIVLATGARARTLPQLPHAADERAWCCARGTTPTGCGPSSCRGATWWWSAPAWSGARWPPPPSELGCRVTLLTPEEVPLERIVGAGLAPRLVALHLDRGVTVRTQVAVAGADVVGGRVTALRLEGGEEIAADVVLVAVGAAPETEWLAGHGGRPRGRGLLRRLRPRARRRRSRSPGSWRSATAPRGGTRTWPGTTAPSTGPTPWNVPVAPWPPCWACPPRRGARTCPTSGPTSTGTGSRWPATARWPTPSTSRRTWARRASSRSTAARASPSPSSRSTGRASSCAGARRWSPAWASSPRSPPNPPPGPPRASPPPRPDEGAAA